MPSYVSVPIPSPPMPNRVGWFSSDLPDIPADVTDLTRWGKTVIQFRQHKAANLSYAELAHTDERSRSYAKWVVARHKTATGLLLDLANFLIRSRTKSDLTQDLAWEPKTPGTDMIRTLKD